jgi:hypothetical protein
MGRALASRSLPEMIKAKSHRVIQVIVSQIVHQHPPNLAALGVRSGSAANRQSSDDDREFLPHFAVAGVEGHVPWVAVDTDEASDLAVDACLLPGLADRGLGQRLAEINRAASDWPVGVIAALNQQDLVDVVCDDYVH